MDPTRQRTCRVVGLFSDRRRVAGAVRCLARDGFGDARIRVLDVDAILIHVDVDCDVRLPSSAKGLLIREGADRVLRAPDHEPSDDS